MPDADDRASFDLVLVGYRPADTRSAVRFCDRTFRPGSRGRKLLVLNSPPTLHDQDLAEGWQTLRGSNTLAEFSGWQEGLEHLHADGLPPGEVLFVNDTVCTHRHFSIFRAWAFERARRRALPARLVAFRDSVPGRSLSIAGFPLDGWASTYCFALSAEALRRLEGRLYDSARLVACVPGGISEDGFFRSLSPDLEAHLRHWLFDGAWYGGARLDDENQGRLTLKARCIVAELLLSARCAARGIEAIDPFREHPWLERADRLERRVVREWQRLVRR
jgi:hypothetical protein